MCEQYREMSNADLESAVFRYDDRYFEFIGESHAPVKRFRELIESRDAEAIAREWPSLETAFVGLERDAGNHSRPYIMDCYLTYAKGVHELCRRRAASRSRS